MAKCAICEELLSEDPADPHCDSAEHIFPNSLGGRRTVSGFICRKCNSMAGETWDAALAKQMQLLSLIFGVSRDRGGETPPLRITTTEGECVNLHDRGEVSFTNPEFESRERSDGSIEYSIKARTQNEARRMVKGLKRKHPELDIEAVLAEATPTEKYLDGDLHRPLRFGGTEAGRSMVKTCLAFAYASGIDWQWCESATAYLRDSKAKACFGYFDTRDLVSGRNAGVPLHCVAVRADPHTGLVIGYAEYFGAIRIVACLGEKYSGPLVEEVYAFDPRRAEDLNVQVSLNFDRETIDATYSHEHHDGDKLSAAITSVIGPALQAQAEAERDRVIERAVDKAFEDCGARPGESLNAEQFRKISHSFVRDLAPLLRHQARGVKRSPRKKGPDCKGPKGSPKKPRAS